mmetsp:Transcript_69474/g.195944  ORF Transcript_69474/g.195944 Transcript_69474/m.195944 type:complete len:207 (+) Transcript_69474:418-1038(+)
MSIVIICQAMFDLTHSDLQRAADAFRASCSKASRWAADITTASSPSRLALAGQWSSPFSARRLWFFLAARRARVSCSDEDISTHLFLGTLTAVGAVFLTIRRSSMKPKVPLISSTTGPSSGSISTSSSLPPTSSFMYPSLLTTWHAIAACFGRSRSLPGPSASSAHDSAGRTPHGNMPAPGGRPQVAAASGGHGARRTGTRARPTP